MEKKGVPINNFFTIFEKALFQRGVEIILTVRRGERQRAMECGCGVFRAGRKGSGYRQGRSSVVRKPRQKDFAERSRVRRSFTKAQASRPWIRAALARVEHGRPLLQRMLPQGESGTSPVSADNVGSPENQSPAARQSRDPLPIFGAFRQAGFTPEAGAPPPGGDSGLFILDISDVHAAFQFGKLRRLPELGLALLPGLLQTGALHGLALNPRFLQHLVPPLFEGPR